MNNDLVANLNRFEVSLDALVSSVRDIINIVNFINSKHDPSRLKLWASWDLDKNAIDPRDTRGPEFWRSYFKTFGKYCVAVRGITQGIKDARELHLLVRDYVRNGIVEFPFVAASYCEAAIEFASRIPLSENRLEEMKRAADENRPFWRGETKNAWDMWFRGNQEFVDHKQDFLGQLRALCKTELSSARKQVNSSQPVAAVSPSHESKSIDSIKGSKQRSPSVNARMLDTITRQPESASWSITEWTTHLKCARATVQATKAWREILEIRKGTAVARSERDSFKDRTGKRQSRTE